MASLMMNVWDPSETLRIVCHMWPQKLGRDLQDHLWEMKENPIFYFQVTVQAHCEA